MKCNHCCCLAKLRRQWKKNGYESLKFDILLDSRHDVVSRGGFYWLLDMSLAWLDCAGNGGSLKFSVSNSVIFRVNI